MCESRAPVVACSPASQRLRLPAAFASPSSPLSCFALPSPLCSLAMDLALAGFSCSGPAGTDGLSLAKEIWTWTHSWWQPVWSHLS
eukprot:621731-Hanusia_phi.AAC.3